MQTFYHGTTDDAARSILREGLQPHRDRAFDMQRIDDFSYSLRDAEGNDPVIYVTTRPHFAQQLAEFRVRYEQTPRNAKILWLDGVRAWRKLSAHQNLNTKPIVLEFTVPDALFRKFTPDPSATEFEWRCTCAIPPKYITTIYSPAGPISKEELLNERSTDVSRDHDHRNQQLSLALA